MEQENTNTVKQRLLTFIGWKGISVRSFETTCGLSNSYVANIRSSIQPDKVSKIAKHFPDLNTGWLLTGEGSMLRGGISQTSCGDNSPNISGSGNKVNIATQSLLDELAAQRQMTRQAQSLTEQAQSQLSKSQEQIDRLLSVIEKLTGTIKGE